MNAMVDPRSRLGDDVEARIHDLGLEYTEVAQRAGISIETLAKVRRGEAVRATTLRKIEMALGWPRGRADPNAALTVAEHEADTEEKSAAAVAEAGEEAGTAVGLHGLADGEELHWQPAKEAGWTKYTLTRDRGSVSYEFLPDDAIEWIVSELQRMLNVAEAAVSSSRPNPANGPSNAASP